MRVICRRTVVEGAGAAFPMLAWAVCALLLAADAAMAMPSQLDARADTVALINVTLIDGTGAPPRARMTVLLHGDRIGGIFPSGGALVPASARVVDLGGQYLIPGLINTHVHLPMIAWARDSVATGLERMLAAGVTTVREMAGDTRLSAELSRARLVEGLPLPGIHYAVRMAGPTFYEPVRESDRAWVGYLAGTAPWAQAVSAETDLVRAVAMAAGTGAAGLKLYSDLDPDVVRRLVAEAHRQGLKAWAHGTLFPAGPLDAVRAGIDGLSHICFLFFGFEPVVAASMADRVPFDPDLVDLEGGPFQELMREMRARGVVLDATARNASQNPGAQAFGCTPELLNRSLEAAHRAGVRLSTGTDYVIAEGNPDPTLLTEIEYLVNAGVLSPLEAITAATLNGAHAIGIEDDYGSIEVGKVADLVVLSGDPSADIGALERVVAVFKDGRCRVGCDGGDVPGRGPNDAAAYQFGACTMAPREGYDTGPVHSLHVPMRDGVRIALDVVLPEGIAEGERVPTLLVMTRHWRATEGAGAHPVQRFFTRHGYAVVFGDVRGTGASFGVWPHHRSRDETLDFGEIIDWIAAQPWSDGQVAGGGVAYGANAADWMVERGRSALRATLSKFPDYDPYVDLYFPGGVPNAYTGRTMGLEVRELDLNTPRQLADGRRVGVRRVDADGDGALVRAAVAARREVPSVWEGLQWVTFKDDAPEGWGGWTMDNWGIHAWKDPVEAAGTPIYSWGSWMNAGTANAVLRRFMTLSNPQRVVVGAWSHGAAEDASPYRPVDAPVDPPRALQNLEDLCWLEQWIRGRDAGTDRLLVYYTMGEERWKSTTEWPLPATIDQDWFFQAGGLLATEAPGEPHGADTYEIDFKATTGTRNRWATNNDGGDVVYGDRARAGERMLVYDSAPLPRDLEITGHPVVTLHVTSTHDDGAFFVYLEDVAPDGRVRYVTEGMLRAIHRGVSAETPPYRTIGPYRSFRRADAAPLVPDEAAELTFEMMPTSVLIRAGHRIRISVAGADADTFQRIPETGSPLVEVHRSAERPSRVRLPVVPRP